MPEDDAFRREISRKLDENSRITAETREHMAKVELNLDKHSTEHEAIKQHMTDVRRTLWLGSEREPGLVEQAIACKMARDQAKGVFLGWQGWLMAIGTISATAIALVMMIWSMTRK